MNNLLGKLKNSSKEMKNSKEQNVLFIMEKFINIIMALLTLLALLRSKTYSKRILKIANELYKYTHIYDKIFNKML